MTFICNLVKAIAVIFLASNVLYASAQEYKATTSTRVANYSLQLLPAPSCDGKVANAEDLKQYLSQYDVELESSLPIHPTLSKPTRANDAPSKNDREQHKKEISKDIVAAGFGYDSERPVVITWMDFDMDGICDFAAPQLVSSMRPITRVFLFRGLRDNKFELVSSGFEYFNQLVPVFPYVPVSVAGERQPVIVVFSQGGSSTVTDILQWNAKTGGFVSCKKEGDEPLYIKKRAALSFAGSAQLKLCEKKFEVGAWVIRQLPNENLAERF